MEQPRPEDEPWLGFYDQDKIYCSKALRDEMADWSINIHGMKWEAAKEWLFRQTEQMHSDGEDCDFREWYKAPTGYGDSSYEFYEMIIPPPPPDKTCICARLLMMLHDVSYTEATKEMFARLLFLLDRLPEVKGEDKSNEDG